MDSNLKITQVIATIDDASAGTSHSVSGLVESLGALGHSVEVEALDGWRSATAAKSALKALITKHPLSKLPVLSGLGTSAAMARRLGVAATNSDILHTHGLWLMPNIYPARAVSQSGASARLVHSPRGMLGAEALQFSQLKKQASWHLLQRRALARADCIHATAPSELAEVRKAGLHNPVAIIPNGITVPPVHKAIRTSDDRTILWLGRIHPKKGLKQLIQAWARIAQVYPNWRLRIVGPNEGGHREELVELVKKLAAPRVDFEDALRGSDRDAAYRDADLFVLPSLNENFANTVAEALSFGVPVISSRGAPWEGLESNGCGWWIGHGADKWEAALSKALHLPDEERAAMGRLGRDWMQRDFAWDKVGGDMAALYSWLKNGGRPPEFVSVD